MTINDALEIAAAFGKTLLELQSSPIKIYDTCYLPHNKAVIEKALIFLIENGQKDEQQVVFTAIMALADYQYGVGPTPIRPVTGDLAEIMDIDPQAAAGYVAENANPKWNEMSVKSHMDRERYKKLISA